MANFTRVKPAGWSLNEILTSAQMNALDIDHAASVNGDAGGSYAGDLTWTGTHTFDGTSGGDVQITDTAKLLIDVNGGEIEFFGAFGPTDGVVKRSDMGGTGANAGSRMVMQASAGQAQTGGNDNNDGGDVALVVGLEGSGGSGLEGAAGAVVQPAADDGLPADVDDGNGFAGWWRWVQNVDVAANTTVEVPLPRRHEVNGQDQILFVVVDYVAVLPLPINVRMGRKFYRYEIQSASAHVTALVGTAGGTSGANAAIDYESDGPNDLVLNLIASNEPQMYLELINNDATYAAEFVVKVEVLASSRFTTL